MACRKKDTTCAEKKRAWSKILTGSVGLVHWREKPKNEVISWRLPVEVITRSSGGFWDLGRVYYQVTMGEKSVIRVKGQHLVKVKKKKKEEL